jgi:hypothetical protein
MKLKYIVTGTGRCGTLNVAHNLTKAGIHCGHESIFNVGGIEDARARLNGEKKIYASDISTKLKDGSIWFDPLLIKADSTYMAAPFLNSDLLEDTIIIHLVRDPLKVISSFVKNLKYFHDLNTDWEKFMCQHLPSIKHYEEPIKRACEYYIQWNKMIAPYAKIRHNIEDDFNDLLNELGLASIHNKSKERNEWSKRDKDFTIDEIPLQFRDRLEDF